MQECLAFLKTHLTHGYLELKTSFEAMKQFNCTFWDIEDLALKNGILPMRYKRNQHTLSTHDQYSLFQSHVAIVGCGGLGGLVAEMLTRLGVGSLTLIDGDTFEEHNLNRQNFSSIATLGRYKTDVVQASLENINPALKAFSYPIFLSLPTHENLLHAANVIVDALDNPSLKSTLAQWAKEHQKSFVHGAIAGYYTQCATNQTLETLYHTPQEGSETKLGNLAFTANFAAAIQSAEVLKILLNKPHLTHPLMGDLWDYELVHL